MKFVEIIVPMTVNVDGAPNTYGPAGFDTLDHELNARRWRNHAPTDEVVGYLTRDGTFRTPIVQQAALGDPFPGYFVSQTAYTDRGNAREADPRRYVNAAEINYTLMATPARAAGAKLGDFCVVHSKRTGLTVFAIIGDAGHRSGAEGSLALLQRLGYAVKNGKSGSVKNAEIVVRYFPGSNPERLFFTCQTDLEAVALTLGLDTDFSEHHADQDRGHLVVGAVRATPADCPEKRVEPFAPLTETPVKYPSHILKLNSDDFISVMLIEKRLRDLGFTEITAAGPQPLTVNGVFDTATFEAVQLFQVRHTDLDGDPLEMDGEVGALTWGALFGRATVEKLLEKAHDPLDLPRLTDDAFLNTVLEIAADEIGVREIGGANRGPRVEEYQRSVSIDPGDAWCVAFVYFCFEKAAQKLRVTNPMKAKCRTGGVLNLWARARSAGIPTITHEGAADDPSRVRPGMIFIVSTGGGFGHTGLVEEVRGGNLITIEGNTNDDGSRDGIGVFRRSGRKISRINTGFIHFQG